MKNKINRNNFMTGIVTLYVVLLILSNVMATRLINVHGLIMDAGTLTYPLLFLIGDLMSEVYGFKVARKIIFVGFLCNFFFVAMTWVATTLPALSNDALTVGYDTVFTYNLRIVTASFICYLAGSLLNAASLVWIRKWTNSRWFAVRTIGSTVLGAFVDTLMFSFLAWYGTVPVNDILVMAATSYAVKLVYESFISTPIAYATRNTVERIANLK